MLFTPRWAAEEIPAVRLLFVVLVDSGRFPYRVETDIEQAAELELLV